MALPPTIRTRMHLRQFMLEVLGELGWGYHPDTRFGDYINLHTGDPTYTPEEALHREALQEQAFEAFGDDVYSLSLGIAYEWAGIRYDGEAGLLVHCDTGAVVEMLPYPYHVMSTQ